MIDKSRLISTINDLPDQINLEDLLDRIMLLEKIELGISDIANGNINTSAQAKEKLKKWLK